MNPLEPPSPEREGEFCHHMGSLLRRTADGSAGPVARLLTHAHTLSCGCCREHLAELKAAQEEK